MNEKELAAAIEAARKNLELAQQDLARLEAIKPEDCGPLMVISPERKKKREDFFFIEENFVSFKAVDIDSTADDNLFSCGNYFRTKEQADAYARVFRTLLLIRRQPGVVGFEENRNVWNIDVQTSNVSISNYPWTPITNVYMFPCFESEASARAAVEAVGADNLIFTARFLAGAEQ